MTTELRTVIDTSIVVSAMLLPNSVPRRAVDLAALQGRLLTSEATCAELAEVLRRPKFDKYLSERMRLAFLTSLVSRPS